MFADLDAPVLKPLPEYPYQYTEVVPVHYHVDLEKHYYSVPYALQSIRLETHLVEHTATLYQVGKVVAQHPRSHPSTAVCPRIMSPKRLLSRARPSGPIPRIGVNSFIRQAEHPAQAVRPCQVLLGQRKRPVYVAI